MNDPITYEELLYLLRAIDSVPMKRCSVYGCRCSASDAVMARSSWHRFPVCDEHMEGFRRGETLTITVATEPDVCTVEFIPTQEPPE